MRISNIYTKTGDDGTTSLGNGTRVSKDDPRITVFGDLDELNSYLGLLLTYTNIPEKLLEIFYRLQFELFDLAGEICTPNHHAIITKEYIEKIESEIDDYSETLPPLREFLIPGGNEVSATCHVARTICRRSERHLVALSRTTPVSPLAVQYLNRLSDLLFVLARVLMRGTQTQEVLWHGFK